MSDGLPDELLYYIFNLLPLFTVYATVPLVCKEWCRVGRDTLLLEALGRRALCLTPTATFRPADALCLMRKFVGDTVAAAEGQPVLMRGMRGSAYCDPTHLHRIAFSTLPRQTACVFTMYNRLLPQPALPTEYAYDTLTKLYGGDRGEWRCASAHLAGVAHARRFARGRTLTHDMIVVLVHNFVFNRFVWEMGGTPYEVDEDATPMVPLHLRDETPATATRNCVDRFADACAPLRAVTDVLRADPPMRYRLKLLTGGSRAHRAIEEAFPTPDR